MELRTGTFVEFDADELSIKELREDGGYVRFVGESDGVVTWKWTPGYKELSVDERMALESWVVLVWPAVALGKVVSLKAQRQTGPVVSASIRSVRSGTRAAYLAALKAGSVKARK